MAGQYLAIPGGVVVHRVAEGETLWDIATRYKVPVAVLDHGNGVTTCYGHCAAVLVEAGAEVRAGQPVALVGSTGRSTGPHLHFEVRVDGRAVDPLPYLLRPDVNNWA